MITIRRARNGYSFEMIDEDPTSPGHFEVFSHNDSELSEAEAVQSLLFAVLENVGPSSSRYSEHRVRVIIEPGDKFESGAV